MVVNPPCSVGTVGLIPGQGTKILHAAEQLSLCAATRESKRSKISRSQIKKQINIKKKKKSCPILRQEDQAFVTCPLPPSLPPPFIELGLLLGNDFRQGESFQPRVT